MRFLATLLFVLMPMTAGVHAAQPADALRVSEIEAQQHALRDVLNARSGRYDAMPKARRKKILASQDRLFVLIEGKATTADLPPADQAEVAALLESITEDINAPGEERVVCTSEAKTGSNFMTRVCRTTRQIREDEEVARGRLQEARRSVCDDKNGCY